MRRNKFNEAYCETAAEVRGELDKQDYVSTDVYGRTIEVEGDEKPAIEVLDNVCGDTVCYIEAATVDECRAVAKAAGVEVTE